jgi:hypothetical protein
MAVAINENILLENLEKVDVFKFSQRISVGSGALSSFQNLLLSMQHPQNNLSILLKKLPVLCTSRAAYTSEGVAKTINTVPVNDSSCF